MALLRIISTFGGVLTMPLSCRKPGFNAGMMNSCENGSFQAGQSRAKCILQAVILRLVLLQRCEVGSKNGPEGVHAKKDIHVSTITTGKRMSCFLMSGLGTALLLLSCSGGSIRSSHASTESRVPKEAANQATGAVIADVVHAGGRICAWATDFSRPGHGHEVPHCLRPPVSERIDSSGDVAKGRGRRR